MEKEHYKEKISAFLNRELTSDEHRAVGEHVLHCQACRKEHDEIKFGMELGESISQFDAPKDTWEKIEATLTQSNTYQEKPEVSSLLSRRFSVSCVSAAVVLCLIAGFYFYVFETDESRSVGVEKQTEFGNSEIAWRVESLTGNSIITDSSNDNSLRVGSSLETDSNSTAKIDVADIGQVEISPNSIVKLVNSTKTEHRLSLERGSLSARIYAPPRLFVVDTPSAAAVDLGCAYKLDVDEKGNSRLHVTSGYVAFEREGLESIVPAGAICLTRRGKGLGTPFAESASENFKEELRKFDFHDGGVSSLERILKLAQRRDSLTLWHLISRVSAKNRLRVFEKARSFAKLPEGVTKEGILRLDKNMLKKWRYDLEGFLYE